MEKQLGVVKKKKKICIDSRGIFLLFIFFAKKKKYAQRIEIPVIKIFFLSKRQKIFFFVIYFCNSRYGNFAWREELPTSSTRRTSRNFSLPREISSRFVKGKFFTFFSKTFYVLYLVNLFIYSCGVFFLWNHYTQNGFAKGN